eukprot:UN06635
MFCTKEHKTSKKKSKRCLCVVDFFSGGHLETSR